MAKKLYEESNIQAIADAIRSKNGSTHTYKTSEMAAAIERIETGGSDSRFKELIERTITEISDNSVESIGNHGLYQNNNLITVNLPNATSFGNYALFSCKNLTSLNAPKLETMGNDALRWCEKLTSVYFPVLKAIPQYGLYYCTKLTNAYMPTVEDIGAYAFGICILMTRFEFQSVKSIGTSAFLDCRRLTTLIIGTANCVLENINAFSQTPIAGYTNFTNGEMGYIYVPDEAVEWYKTATNWSTYASQIKGISELPQE